MKRFVVLGGTGFLGRALAQAIARRGDAAIVVGRSRPTGEATPGDWVFCDLADPTTDWSAIVRDSDGAFHLGWSTIPRTANSDPPKDAEANVMGTIRLLEAMGAARRPRLVFVSSGGTVYGRADNVPIREDHPLRPLTAYGVSKASAEAYCLWYRRARGVDARIARLGNLFGAGQDVRGELGAATIFAGRAIAGLPIEIWGDGTIIRDYLYVDDAVAGILALMDASAGVLGEEEPVFNLGSGQGVSLNEIVRVLEELLRRPVAVHREEARTFDVPANVLDIGRARSLLGWNPTVGLSEGLARILAIWRDTAEPLRGGASRPVAEFGEPGVRHVALAIDP